VGGDHRRDLEGDQTAPRKQRHTAHRIWTRLVKEWDAKVAEPTVRRYVRERRRELFGVVEAMVPQVHQPGEEAEVDRTAATAPARNAFIARLERQLDRDFTLTEKGTCRSS
jgi:hypothetical protein